MRPVCILPQYDRIFPLMIDLHAHSTASDGSLSPTQLIELAAERGLAAIALTDHDTIAGVGEAAERAKALGLRFIPGVEIEISWEPGEFHLLGLGIHTPTKAFTQALEEVAHMRWERNQQILDRMKELSIDGTYDEVKSLARGDIIGRPHFAELLQKKGIVKNKEQAFSRYLGKGKPLYAPKGALELRRALSIIKESGGVAILAHPLSLYVSWGRMPALLQEFKDIGMDGIEAWHPIAKVGACRRLEKLGHSLGFLVTAGSDYHGAGRPERKLGITAGDKTIEDSYMEGIPDAAMIS